MKKHRRESSVHPPVRRKGCFREASWEASGTHQQEERPRRKPPWSQGMLPGI